MWYLRGFAGEPLRYHQYRGPWQSCQDAATIASQLVELGIVKWCEIWRGGLCVATVVRRVV